MACLVCGSRADVGSLCRSCARQVAPCEGLIADHVHSTTPRAAAAAWLVDGFGAAHAVAARAGIGRSVEGPEPTGSGGPGAGSAGWIAVLAPSVSREHAELRAADGGWQVRDLGSRNGTFVGGARCQGRVALPPRAVLRVGEVALWFLAEARPEPGTTPSLATGSAGAGLVRYALQHGAVELCVVGTADASIGGALLGRGPGAASWTERPLPPLELHLLRALCARAIAEAGSPAAVRGCVPTKQLARELPFQSRYANEENVRQVVRRVRAVLAELGAEGALGVAPGRGYYLACSVAAPQPTGASDA
jgi:hypothetical protein